MSPPIRVALVEDSAAFRQRLRDFLNRSPGVECVATFPTAGSALAALPDAAPAVVLMDLQLPDLSGIDCIARLKPRLPAAEFMIFTVHEDSDQIFQALEAGASGYLLKRSVPAEILTAIRELHAGGAPMSSEIARKVVQSFRRSASSTARPALESLSPRQHEILRWLAQGLTVKEIAAQLGLSAETIRSYLKLVYQKLHVRSRTEALLKYLG